jgi:hypothetical protein
LSLLDLCDVAVAEEDEHLVSTAVTKLRKGGESDHLALERYFESQERELLSKARVARARLLDVLDWFFHFRHLDDREGPREKRDYLRRVLNTLASGDVVITLNWDTTVERTLAEDGRWNPRLGYGFEKRLEVVGPLGRPAPLPPEMFAETDVVVLKLHGSFGWRQRDDLMYFQTTEFLNAFGYHYDRTPVSLRDADAPAFFSSDPPLIAYPSFLKRLDHPVIDGIWRQATEALFHAAELDIWGYSLPAGDSAVRVLLQTATSRCRTGDMRVRVHDPSRSTLERWSMLFGHNAELRGEQL